MEFDKPDTSSSDQLLSSLKNLLITFTPTIAGKQYLEFAMLANNYWIRFFDHQTDLKSKPKLIFTKLAELVEKKDAEIAALQKMVGSVQNENKFFEIEIDKILVRAVVSSNILFNSAKRTLRKQMLTQRNPSTSGILSNLPVIAPNHK